MYAGAITEATPTPTPPITRNAMSIPSELASPVPTALTRNSTAATRIVHKRP